MAASVDSLCLTTVSQVLASRAKFGLRETATICFEGQDSVLSARRSDKWYRGWSAEKGCGRSASSIL